MVCVFFFKRWKQKTLLVTKIAKTKNATKQNTTQNKYKQKKINEKDTLQS